MAILKKLEILTKTVSLAQPLLQSKKTNSKNSFRLTETQRNYREKEGTNAEYEGVNIDNIKKIADVEADEIWISKFDLDYAYGQLLLSKNAMDLTYLR